MARDRNPQARQQPRHKNQRELEQPALPQPRWLRRRNLPKALRWQLRSCPKEEQRRRLVTPVCQCVLCCLPWSRSEPVLTENRKG
jgi:hypothetical protein